MGQGQRCRRQGRSSRKKRGCQSSRVTWFGQRALGGAAISHFPFGQSSRLSERSSQPNVTQFLGFLAGGIDLSLKLHAQGPRTWTDYRAQGMQFASIKLRSRELVSAICLCCCRSVWKMDEKKQSKR